MDKNLEITAIRDRIVSKTNELTAIPWTQERIKKAAQTWLDNRDDRGEAGRKAAADYAEALRWGVATIDEVIAHFESAGTDAELADVKAQKAKGITTCQCPACKLCEELYALKDYFVI